MPLVDLCKVNYIYRDVGYVMIDHNMGEYRDECRYFVELDLTWDPISPCDVVFTRE